jgi:hypothetical protein
MTSNRRSAWLLLLAALGLSVALPERVDARVVRFVVERTRPVLDGKSFGTAGAYERLDGMVYLEVDPGDPLNAVIVNLDKAPRTPGGKVGFSAPFYLLKPVDMARGNRKIFYGINNRGNKLEYAWRTFVAPGVNSNDPTTEADFGDALLLRLGYVYVDAGWQGNLAAGNSRLIPDLPVPMQADGRPITANVRVEFADATGFTRPLEGNADHVSRVPYEPVGLTTADATLTVRDGVNGARTAVPANRWAFGRCQNGAGSLVPTGADLCLFDGFKADRIYELTYRAKNPRVLGLGYAVTRDLASFLRYEARDDAGNPNPLAESGTTVGIRRAYGNGISSTGMYMRDWLYLGFNEDEAHRKVFDAVQITIPGTHRLLANVEFADPNNYSRQDLWHDSISYSYPPLTFGVTTDPISGKRDGILKRPATDPLVFQADSANEFWQMNASLNVADGAGRPVEIPPNVRLYFASSFQHGGGAGLLNPPGPVGMCQHPTQGNSWAPTLRALTVALDEWADKGIEPPPSNYPRLTDKTLVSVEEARASFPVIPGVTFPSVINELALPDFGPAFGPTGGRLVKNPPALGAKYQLFVPRPDADGLDIAGIRPMEVAAPLATITGWALRAAGRREGSLCGLSGSFIPFAPTRAARQQSGDPRPSLEERYGDGTGLVTAVTDASRKLVAARFLLQEDADRYVKAARERAMTMSTAGTATQENAR